MTLNLEGRAIKAVFALGLGTLALVVLFADQISTASAEVPSETVIVRLVPESEQVEPGATSTLDVIIEPHEREISGAQVFVDFDNSRLSVLSVQFDGGSPFNLGLANKFGNSTGAVDMAAGMLFGSANSKFKMATIAFQVKDVTGATTFRLATSSPRNTLTSFSTSSVATTLIDASLTVQRQSLVDLRIVPQTVAVQPSQPFTLEIRVEPNGQSFTGVQAFLNFDPKSLQVVSLVAGSSSPLSVPLINRFDNSAGTLDFAAGIIGSTTNTPFILAVVTMRGGASGDTTLVEFSTESPRTSRASMGGDQIQRNLFGTSVTIHNAPGVPNLTLMGLLFMAGAFLILIYVTHLRRRSRQL